jgi:hypothetical protein
VKLISILFFKDENELNKVILNFQMTAELQVPSPLVPTRESYFVRYCKQHADGTWAVVDVSLDNLRPSPSARCRRRPSGCLIQEMPNGYSKVSIKKLFIYFCYNFLTFLNKIKIVGYIWNLLL